MTHYVLDTGFFIVTRGYYLDSFPSFWEKMDGAVGSNLISSVREVRDELKKYGGEQEHLLEWISNHADIFSRPGPEEQKHVREILEVKAFQSLVEKRKILKGGPSADPFVIAKAMTIEDAAVVTGERPANRDKNGNIQGSPRIPDVCQHFGIDCISPEEFMRREQWQF